MPEASPLVPQFRELTVDGGGRRLDELATAIEAVLEQPWQRDLELEASRALEEGQYKVFRRDRAPQAPGLRVFLVTSSTNDQAYVSNIVPSEVSELTMDQYNDAAAEFYERFCRDVATRLGLNSHLSEPFLNLADVLDANTYQALRSFSNVANKSTGAAHPLDRDMWFAFIIGVHRANANLEWDVLKKWLMLEGWSDEITDRLIDEYDLALRILEYAQSH